MNEKILQIKESLAKNKARIFEKYKDRLRESFASLTNSIDITRRGAIDAPGRMQSRYDTNKIELSWLANSLSQRVQKFSSALNAVERFDLEEKTIVCVGSIVILTYGDAFSIHFLIPPNGESDKLDFESLAIHFTTVNAPLVLAFLGRELGYEFEFRGRFYEVSTIL